MRGMQVHVVWFPLALSSGRRRRLGLVAYLSPGGDQVVYLDDHNQSTALPSSAERPHLARYLTDARLASHQLRALIGEIRLPSGESVSRLLLRDILNVLLLSEEPPGNPPVPADLPLPLESVHVVNQGSEWPGYESASLEPDGDVLVNHVILASLLPQPSA